MALNENQKKLLKERVDDCREEFNQARIALRDKLTDLRPIDSHWTYADECSHLAYSLRVAAIDLVGVTNLVNDLTEAEEDCDGTKRRSGKE